MIKEFSRLTLYCLGLMWLAGYASADNAIEVGWFSKSTTDAVFPQGWEPFNLTGSAKATHYELVKDAGTWVARAESQGAATAMLYPIKIDLASTPVIEWRWKIDHVLQKGDARYKEGDDYPARLYIIFDYDKSRLSWLESLAYEAYYALYGVYPPLAALNYLWANKLPVGTLLPNSYSERVQMYAVQSGSKNANKWVVQRRNIYKDYLRAFGEQPPAIAGIAIMTDTDNTGEKAIAYYGDIRLLPE